MPYAKAESEQTVDKGREGRTLGQDENESESEQQDHDRREPPFFSDAEEAPELAEDGKFSVHLELFFVIGRRRTGGTRLPISRVVGFEPQVDESFSKEALQKADRGHGQEEDNGEKDARADGSDERSEAHPWPINEAEKIRRDSGKKKEQNSERRERPAGAAMTELKKSAKEKKGESDR